MAEILVPRPKFIELNVIHVSGTGPHSSGSRPERGSKINPRVRLHHHHQLSSRGCITG